MTHIVIDENNLPKETPSLETEGIETDFVELSQEHKKQTQKALFLLGDLCALINTKRSQIIEKRAEIDAKLSTLPEDIRSVLNTEEYAKSGKSIEQFVELLDKMLEEVEADCEMYRKLEQVGYPEVLVQSAQAPEGVDHIASDLLQRVATIKQYAKAVNRDLSISYSRYCFGFDEQFKQLDYLEHIAKKAKRAA